MAGKKSTLGRGLDAVFLENETEASSGSTLLPIARIEPNPSQPRRVFDEDALQALADSIRENGVIQPIAVRSLRPGDERYQIVAGERRWRAARLAGLTEVPVVILELDDAHAAQAALVENLQREDLNPLEEAQAYAELGQRFSMTQQQIAQRVGKSRSAVANALRLLELPPTLLPLVETGVITPGHARAILSCACEQDRQTLADLIVARSLSVRAAESAAKALAQKRNRAAQEAAQQPKTVDLQQRMTQTYLREIAQRASQRMERQVHIVQQGKRRFMTLSYEKTDDLEALLRQLCGADFFAGENR